MIYHELRPKKNRITSRSNVSMVQEKALHSVQISRDWELPPKIKPGRKPNRKSTLVLDDSTNVNVSNKQSSYSGDSGNEITEKEVRGHIMGSANYADRRRKQNRDAQRAYRERKAGRLEDLMKTVDDLKSQCESLSDEIALWKSRYEEHLEESRIKLQDAEDRSKLQLKENDNLRNTISKLQAQVHAFEKFSSVPSLSTSKITHSHVLPTTDLQADLKSSLTCSICRDGSCICDEIYSDDLASAPLPSGISNRVQNSIDNFKLNQAVELKKRRPETFSMEGLPRFKRLYTPRPIESDNIQMTTKEISEAGCGFCSDQSACVCREIEQQASPLMDKS